MPSGQNLRGNTGSRARDQGPVVCGLWSVVSGQWSVAILRVERKEMSWIATFTDHCSLATDRSSLLSMSRSPALFPDP